MTSQHFRSQRGQAERMLASAPQPIDLTAWYKQHEALGYHLLHMMAKAMVLHTDEALQEAGQAHGALRQHAKLIAGDAVPVVLTPDGQRTIGYEQLAEALAKNTTLWQELQTARTAHDAARALLIEVADCFTRGQELPSSLPQRISELLQSTPDTTHQAVEAIASGEAFDTHARAHELASREFNAGRQAMHADIMTMLTRRLAELAAASGRYPQMASDLTRTANVLKVAKQQVEELQP